MSSICKARSSYQSEFPLNFGVTDADERMKAKFVQSIVESKNLLEVFVDGAVSLHGYDVFGVWSSDLAEQFVWCLPKIRSLLVTKQASTPLMSD